MAICLLCLSGCEQRRSTDASIANQVNASSAQASLPTLSLLETIKAKGHIEIASRNGPTTFYEGRNGPTGFEYQLAQLFAKEIGVGLKISNSSPLQDIFGGLESGDVDIAAAGLTVTPARKNRVNFSQAYFDVTEQLIFHKSNTKPNSPADLVGHSIVVIADSSHAERLRQLKTTYPELTWTEQKDIEPIDLLEKIENGEFEFTILDSNEFIVNRGLYPNVRIGFDLSEPQQLAWALPKGDDGSLKAAVDNFFQRINTDGTLELLKEQFYGHSVGFTQVSSRTFMRKMKRRLPNYIDDFKDAASKYNLDWQLLAAMAYQESHLNPRAKSPTGVRGMMMLTLITAKEMGVKNRIDAKQSIYGGAKYFNKIINRLSKDISDTDRTWFALAAYNVGWGHLGDARIITEQQGGDPNSWQDVKQRLPLLQKKAYYKKTRYGYARGQEPVNYVKNIRHYYNLLAWSEILEQRHLASLDSQLPIKKVNYEVAKEPLYKLSLL